MRSACRYYHGGHGPPHHVKERMENIRRNRRLHNPEDLRQYRGSGGYYSEIDRAPGPRANELNRRGRQGNRWVSYPQDHHGNRHGNSQQANDQNNSDQHQGEGVQPSNNATSVQLENTPPQASEGAAHVTPTSEAAFLEKIEQMIGKQMNQIMEKAIDKVLENKIDPRIERRIDEFLKQAKQSVGRPKIHFYSRTYGA